MKGDMMRPYIHHIHKLENDNPGEHIATVKGKVHFRKWVKRRYFEKCGSRVCFCLDADSPYYGVIPFVALKGKSKVKDRIIFFRIGCEPDNPVNDIPF